MYGNLVQFGSFALATMIVTAVGLAGVAVVALAMQLLYRSARRLFDATGVRSARLGAGARDSHKPVRSMNREEVK